MFVHWIALLTTYLDLRIVDDCRSCRRHLRTRGGSYRFFKKRNIFVQKAVFYEWICNHNHFLISHALLFVFSRFLSSLLLRHNLFCVSLYRVPANTPTCNYNRNCGDVLSMVNVTATNENLNATRTLRFTLSRSFETGTPTFGSPAFASPSAEITGMTVMLWDTNTGGGTPNGIPLHISKNWHGGKASNPTYRFTWWTANVLVHLPPNSRVDWTFAIVYEQFRGIPAFSYAQLSTVGLASRWFLHAGALGTGGENFVVDPIGALSRSMITNVRGKFFDGALKRNVGGGDFLVYFNPSGAYQYSKQVNARLLANGPCLSNATYTSLSQDGAIQSTIQISGGRTDDMVRMFIHVRHEALRSTGFSRLAFFQMGSETYNWHPTFDRFVFGTGDAQTNDVERMCSSGSPSGMNRTDLYDTNGQFFRRDLLGSSGPWWIALGPNSDPTRYRNDKQVVSDRGLVIRSFDASFGGQPYNRPSVSILCDKVEIGPPRRVRSLSGGDFVDFKMEFLILP